MCAYKIIFKKKFDVGIHVYEAQIGCKKMCRKFVVASEIDPGALYLWAFESQ